MAVISIALDLQGDPLMALQAATLDLKPALRASVGNWRLLIAEEFQNQAWRPPSGPFRAWKAVEDFGSRKAPARILHRSGALEGALLGGAGSFTNVSSTSAAFGLTGTMATIAAVHRGGSGEVRAADSRVPQKIGVTAAMRWKLGFSFGVWLKADTNFIEITRRPFATVSPELRTRVTAIFSAHVAGRALPERLVA